MQHTNRHLLIDSGLPGRFLRLLIVHLLVVSLLLSQYYHQLSHAFYTSSNDYLTSNTANQLINNNNNNINAIPQFQQHNNILSFHVNENAPNGTLLGNIRSNDGQPPYLILPVPSTPESERIAALSVNLLNGDLITNTVLDREQRDQYQFVAIVKEPFAEIRCTVIVRDVNDNAPAFLLPDRNSQAGIIIEMPEGQRGFRKQLPLAYDRDSFLYGIQEFFIVDEGGNTPKNTFALVEHGAPPRSSLLQSASGSANNNQEEPNLPISQNDNPHLMQQWAQLATVLIPSQPPVISSTQTSQLGSATQVPFSYYRIDIESNHTLDREDRSDYHFVIEVRDRGTPPLTGRLNVTILVQDINDNEPVFTRKEYETQVKENALTGSLILRVQATDADIDNNANITYYISSKQQQQRHSSTSQQYILNSNSNSSDNYEQVVATGSSSSRQQANNKLLRQQAPPTPSSSQQQQSAKLASQQRIQNSNGNYDELPSQSASPVKQAGSSSNKILYPTNNYSQNGNGPSTLSGASSASSNNNLDSSSLFEIDSRTGEIYLAHQLDYESEQVHEFIVEARDHGKPARSGFASVKVIVLDVNDDPPPPQAPEKSSSLQDATLPSRAFPFTSSSNGKLLGASDLSAEAVSLTYANLINWFTQINPTLVFFVVLLTMCLLSALICFAKVRSRHPESDYNDTAGLTLITNANEQVLKGSPKTHSISPIEQQQQQLHHQQQQHTIGQQQHNSNSLNLSNNNNNPLHHRHLDTSSFAGLIMDGSTNDKLSRYQTNQYTTDSNLYHNPYTAQQLSHPPRHSSSSHHQTLNSHVSSRHHQVVGVPSQLVPATLVSMSMSRQASNQMLASDSLTPPSVVAAAATPVQLPSSALEGYNEWVKWVECSRCSVSYNWDYLADWTPEYHTIMPLLQGSDRDRFMR